MTVSRPRRIARHSSARVTRLVALGSCIACCFLLAACGAAESPTSQDDQSDRAGAEDSQQSDWENQTGSDWDEFVSGYETGWDAGCQDVTAVGESSSLYYEESEYTASDCEGNAGDPSDVPDQLPDSPEDDGMSIGYPDGCESIFDIAGTDTLFDGTTYVSRADCESNPVTSAERGGGQAPAEKPADVVLDCANFNMDGEVDGLGAGWYDISTRNVPCDAAKRMLLADVGPAPEKGTAGNGFTCVELAAEGETADFRCTKGNTAIRYSFGS